MAKSDTHFNLCETVEERLENYILENHLTAGDRLPSERDLSERWGISRTIIRQVIKLMIANGILEQRVGSGTFLLKKKLCRNLQDMQSIVDTARQSGRSLETRVLYLGIIESNKQIMMRLQIPIGHRIYKLVRMRYLDGVPFSLETNYLNAAHLEGFDTHDYSRESLYRVFQECYNIVPDRGEETVGLTYITDEESQLLQIAPNTAAFYCSGVCTEPSGKPIDYFKLTTRPEFLRYTSLLRQQ
ncbi:MAG: GntR family transcriptional regulator [Enterocloster asparagiformis]|nr:GntR family transcriptional regulator [Enterocloster asparagiformis]